MNKRTSIKTKVTGLGNNVGFKEFRKSNDTRKEIVRNPEVPISNCDIISLDVEDEGSSKQKGLKLPKEVKNTLEPKHDFSKPQLHSSLKIAQNIRNLEKAKTKEISTAQKGTVKRVNIPFNEKMYKDLIELRVREEQFVGSTRSREVASSKDPEPILAQFYKPTFANEYTVKFAPPPLPVEKEWSFDGYVVSNAINLSQQYE